MDVTIQCRNAEVPERLRATAREKVLKVSRHLDGWEHAEIHFSEERNPRIADREVCEVTLRGHGHVVRAKAAAPDTLAAVDKVVEKLDHQVARLKTRLIRRSHPRRPAVASDGRGPAEALGEDEAEEEAEEGPRFVKTKHFSSKPMTPEEAALQMDLLGHDFYFFTNADTGLATVVYRRHDGDLGLIDGA
ncbi:MAG TPA: ribosome-associated translation inhibitor RaiA [Acidimicrobiales bacterium]|nr:ribosome-associated translation inhibitor RaiA [Acidimicrobiales bacterium]